jgi:hypothetical protein
MDPITELAFIAFWIAVGFIVLATLTGIWAGVRHRRNARRDSSGE